MEPRLVMGQCKCSELPYNLPYSEAMSSLLNYVTINDSTPHSVLYGFSLKP